MHGLVGTLGSTRVPHIAKSGRLRQMLDTSQCLQLRGMLVDEMEFLGFSFEYDFLYLPIDRSTQWNVGAFVCSGGQGRVEELITSTCDVACWEIGQRQS